MLGTAAPHLEFWAWMFDVKDSQNNKCKKVYFSHILN
jgi:hypothetical protein